MPERARAVLFDFDGTLADTAPDLCGALNRMRVERGLEPLPHEVARPWATSGARGLLRIGFGLSPGNPEYEDMRERFLACYAEAICEQTRLFAGIEELLAALAARGIAWGIVTNKSERLTGPIVDALGLSPACVVCGDTTPHLKPHPASLEHAARALALPPAACWYLGDDLRDVQAARAAGMRPVAVEWGYHGTENGAPGGWNADAVIAHPLEMLARLEAAAQRPDMGQ